MAEHIANVRTSKILKVTKAAFYKVLRSGDLLFVSGRAAASRGIEDETKSPWSHVARVWLPQDSDVWVVQQATIDRDVAIGPLAYYADGNDGDIVLARRPCLTDADQRAITDRMMGVLGEAYDWQDEVKIVASKLLPLLKFKPISNEEYCSGYVQYGSQAVPGKELQHPETYAPTPEDNWTDPSVFPACALLAGGE